MTELEKETPAGPELVGFRAIQSKRLYQQIAEQIEAYIGSGGLKPGDRLPSEREMAVMFGVSRPSVREAMIALEGARLIEVRTGEGTFIISAEQSAQRFGSAAFKGAGPGVLEQFQARLTLEPPLAAMAAERVGSAELAILRESVDAAEARFARGDLADDEDYAFHVQLAAFSGNRILADVVRELWDLRASETWRVIRARVATRDQRLETVSRRRGILEALDARNGKLAETRMRDLLDIAMHRYFGDTLPGKAKRPTKFKD
jgi:DNA-binding FadR family transcriptional regulator